MSTAPGTKERVRAPRGFPDGPEGRLDDRPPVLTLLPALSLFLYTHRRMAVTGDDVSLDQIVPISRDFALEEGATGGWTG